LPGLGRRRRPRIIAALDGALPPIDTELMSSASVARTLTALADPTRVEIVERLSEGDASVTELAGAFPMSLRNVLKHVHVLEDAGLVRTEKRGRVRRCGLRPDALTDTARWMDHLRRRWERRLDRLEDYLRDNPEET
jgi:DNA-binding transcriptional ArsR family regulator